MGETTRDPFGERHAGRHRRTRWLFGAQCVFSSDSAQLMGLVDHACAGLPPQRLPGRAPRCHIELRTGRAASARDARMPPPPATAAGAGILAGVVDAANYAIVVPCARSALVVLAPPSPAASRLARYELIEFALLTLLSRVRGLVPLHAACVGRGGRGLLLLGESGAGKSTLCLHAATTGFDILGEDSVFVDPGSLAACALPSFVHVRCDSTAALAGTPWVQALGDSARIQRRNGVEKFEIDLRGRTFARPAGPLQLAGVVRLSAECASEPLWRPLAARAIAQQLRREQQYAGGQPGWRPFLASLARVPGFELRRGVRPELSVAALESIYRECAP